MLFSCLVKIIAFKIVLIDQRNGNSMAKSNLCSHVFVVTKFSRENGKCYRVQMGASVTEVFQPLALFEIKLS